jgi:hypothetical protein
MSKRACCKFFEEQQRLMAVRIKVLHAIGANKPRDVVMMADEIKRSQPWLLELLSGEHCPCQDHPNPELFGKWIGRIVQAREAGRELTLEDAIDLGESLLFESPAEDRIPNDKP